MNRTLVVAAAMLGWASGAGSQSAAGPRDIGPPIATSMALDGRPMPAQLVERSDGSVFFFWRSRMMQVLLLNPMLIQSKPVRYADSNGIPFHYGNQGGALVGWRGDTTLFIDATVLINLFIDGDGVIRAERAAPRPSDQGSLGAFTGAPLGDGRGSLIYSQRVRVPPADPTVKQDSVVLVRDLQQLVRVDLATRRLDTLAVLEAAVIPYRQVDGRMVRLDSPIPVSDSWTVLSDGTVAIVHGAAMTLIDSARGTRVVQLSGAAQRTLSLDERRRILDSAVKAQPLPAPAAPGLVVNLANRPRVFPPADALPDQPSVFSAFGTKADQHGRIWLKRISDPHNVYSVFDRNGTLVATVRLPPDGTLLSIGRMGVYMAVPESSRQSFRIVRFALP